MTHAEWLMALARTLDEAPRNGVAGREMIALSDQRARSIAEELRRIAAAMTP